MILAVPPKCPKCGNEDSSSFRLIAKGSGYLHREGDHGSLTLLGYRCDKCGSGEHFDAQGNLIDGAP